jgi:protein gp37
VADNTGIEWCDATWNPVTGCTEVSPGCDHCYANTFAERWRGTPGHYFENGFDVQLRPEKLDQPLRWKRPRRIFVNSMSDLFHDSVPDEYIARVFAVMAVCPDHTFQLLTKRHGRMRALLSGDFRDQVAEEITDMMAAATPPGRYWPVTFDRTTTDGFNVWGPSVWPLPNVWLGVSTENQKWADIRVPALLETPAAVRFVSAEPLLGPIDLHTDPIEAESPFWGSQLDWVIVGGESGHGARPMHPDWVRGLRDQCEDAGVAFLFKQWGEWRGHLDGHDYREPHAWVNVADGRVADEDTAISDGGDWTGVWRFGKKAAGREVDGRTWDEYPEAVMANG